MHSFIALGLSLLPFVAAQSNEIAAIKAHFASAGLVPSLLNQFEPTATLTVNFPGVGNITPGQALTKEQTKPEPAVTVNPADPSTQFSGNYTLFMVDADIPGTDIQGTGGVNRHWLVNGVTIGADKKVSVASGLPITAYAGPGPAAGSGPHRYVILLYVQPANFIAPAEFQPGSGVAKFGLGAYIEDSQLGPLVGAIYMQVQEQTATVSVSPTSTVNSATLVAPSSAGSAGSTSGTPRTSGSTGAPAPSQSGSGNNGAATVGVSLMAVMFAAIGTLFA